MFFHPQQNQNFSSETGALKLGRICESFFLRQQTDTHQIYMNFVKAVKAIPNLEFVDDFINQQCSVRLSRSILENEKEVQHLVNVLHQNLIQPNRHVDQEETSDEERTAQDLINAIIRLTGLNLTVPNTPRDEPTASRSYQVA